MTLDGDKVALWLSAAETTMLTFEVMPAAQPTRRARIAADVTVDGQQFGEQAEALVTTI